MEGRETNEDARGSGAGGNDENLNYGRREAGTGRRKRMQKMLWKQNQEDVSAGMTGCH